MQPKNAISTDLPAQHVAPDQMPRVLRDPLERLSGTVMSRWRDGENAGSPQPSRISSKHKKSSATLIST